MTFDTISNDTFINKNNWFNIFKKTLGIFGN